MHARPSRHAHRRHRDGVCADQIYFAKRRGTFDLGVDSRAIDKAFIASAVETEITTRLAAYKRPRRLHVVEQLPRTATGKLVRNQAVLRDIGPSG